MLGSLLGPSCSSIELDGTGTAAEPPEPFGPGEVCDAPSPATIRVRIEPSEIFVPACATPGSPTCTSRRVQVIVDPDFCTSTPVRFAVSDPAIVAAPAETTVRLHHPTVDLDVSALTQVGDADITVRVPKGDGTDATATLTVHVLDSALPVCEGTASKSPLGAGETLGGEGGLSGASIGLQAGADAPNSGSFLWHVDPFDATLGCADDILPEGYVALGPAITFGPETKVLPRDIPLSVPVNPALMPTAARLRHVRVAYSSPDFPGPRTAVVADQHFDAVAGAGGWALTFKAPRLGTYQAVVAKDAGTKTRTRRLTHRAIIGVSMGGAGTAMVGMRNHHLFDVLAPLGGPVEWTYMLHQIETNHLGGFPSILPGTQLSDIALERTLCSATTDCSGAESCIGGKCTLMPIAQDVYEHPQTFNTWWYEYPRTGNGGSFAREEYSQIFRDLALMFGNPNGDNLTKGAENLPAGVRPDDKSQLGDHPGDECSVWVDPIGDSPDEATQKEIANSCPKERCAHPLTLTGYYDDEYNPDGIFPVITVCDGSPQDQSLSPYSNTWKPEGNDFPLEVGLAVDYNGNGQRDEMEPIIRAGHEPWKDFGTDGKPSVLEPGYQAGVNEDPAGDDFHVQYNPSGTEGDFRWQEGEPFDDVGLDGVLGTPQQPAYPVGWQNPGDGYDVGEGDGKFTTARGLQTFWDRDANGVVRRFSTPPGGDVDDAALSRIDLWTDGGTRDLFNSAVSAQHLVGAFAARGRDVGLYTDFVQHPGLDRSQPNQFVPARTVYDDMPGIVLQRYGKIDPEEQDIETGSGQHVGTANEIASRLQAALYFIGSRWKEPELRQRVWDTQDAPVENIEPCQELGNCTFEFTSSFGRKGVVGVTLPPGYGHKDQQDRRYPVIFMLHGYGQTPDDLEAAIVFLRNWMNSPADGMDSRLPKAILVYVDGRCRVDDEGKAECIRGTFFTDSVRETGVLNESWWMELVDHVDANYRTMGESEITISE